jgi:hypothetical protein
MAMGQVGTTPGVQFGDNTQDSYMVEQRDQVLDMDASDNGTIKQVNPAHIRMMEQNKPKLRKSVTQG